MVQETEVSEKWVEEEEDDEAPAVQFDIASYPSDLTLSVVHEMWKEGSIEIPEYQRNYVWNVKQASLLVESFLLGLPVPQVFFYVDEDSKNQVIDGQQRITSIVYFLDGYFGDPDSSDKKKPFRLQGLSKKSPYYNKRFSELDESAQRKFKGSVLRAVNIRQLSPKGEATSVYHIFERLNTGGTPLQPQEIRNCVYIGTLTTILQKLNKLETWRKIIGKAAPDRHQKDVELLLRIFSLWAYESDYEKPMKEFLNRTMAKEKSGESANVEAFERLFPPACELVVDRLGEKPCHLRGRLNSSALDALMATVLNAELVLPNDFADRYERLKQDEDFRTTTHISTSDVQAVALRMETTRKILLG